MLPVSLDCPFFIPSVFSSIYFSQYKNKHNDKKLHDMTPNEMWLDKRYRKLKDQSRMDNSEKLVTLGTHGTERTQTKHETTIEN